MKLPTDLPHPVQPLIDVDGVTRFKANAIVRHLLDAGPFDMNALAIMPFSVEDQEQFAQLIGLSIGLYGDLPWVTDEAYQRAAEQIVTETADNAPPTRIALEEGAAVTIHSDYGIVIEPQGVSEIVVRAVS